MPFASTAAIEQFLSERVRGRLYQGNGSIADESFSWFREMICAMHDSRLIYCPEAHFPFLIEEVVHYAEMTASSSLSRMDDAIITDSRVRPPNYSFTVAR